MDSISVYSLDDKHIVVYLQKQVVWKKTNVEPARCRPVFLYKKGPSVLFV